MLAFAIYSRSRPLLFAWCWVLVSLLPVAFIAHYSGFFLYLPMAGWSLYVAVLLVMARKLLAALLLRLAVASDVQAERLQIASIVALPVLLAVFLAPCHRRETLKTLRIFESVQPPSRRLAAEMIALRPRLPRGARVLFLGDPFARDDYFLLFLTRLLYRDMTITVDRTPPSKGFATGRDCYDAVFQLSPSSFAACARRLSSVQNSHFDSIAEASRCKSTHPKPRPHN
jgi:hypothetical protein